ncbi:MAG TPA: hypothetical protein VHZ33_00600 [Trebonia sp.]|nr:hypothetical protein [Trebonia sp.]
MLNNTIDVTVAPCGAAFPGARSPWINLSAVQTEYVRTPNLVPVAVAADARLAAFEQIPAMTEKQLVAQATLLPTVTNRKHNVYKTRVNAGGGGASGPHPEREPA